jgi:hypothetical protein
MFYNTSVPCARKSSVQDVTSGIEDTIRLKTPTMRKARAVVPSGTNLQLYKLLWVQYPRIDPASTPHSMN